MTIGNGIVARARRCIGAPFRPQGRDPAHGLDCVGVAAFAIGSGSVRSDYSLRGGSARAIAAELRRAGLTAAAGEEPGDVLVMQAGPAQLHLGIWTGAGLVHADAGLRRVVERPGPIGWKVLGRWRVPHEPAAAPTMRRGGER